MSDLLSGSWSELKTQIRQAWSKLADEDMSKVEGNWEVLSEKIQDAYGYTKEKADEEIRRFRRSHSLN